MRTRYNACCDACRGTAPHMFCRADACDCHREQQRAPGPTGSLYRDPTADKAIGNITRKRPTQPRPRPSLRTNHPQRNWMD